MARDFYQLDETQRVALLHQRIHQRLIAQQKQQQQQLLQPQKSQDSGSINTLHGVLAPTSSSNGDWWSCDNFVCNFLAKYSVSKSAGKVFAGLCCVGACVAVELAVLAEGAQHHFEEMYQASTCFFNFTLVIVLYWRMTHRRHKEWLNLIDISVSLLAGGLILGPSILLYNATFAEPDDYLKALTPQPTAATVSSAAAAAVVSSTTSASTHITSSSSSAANPSASHYHQTASSLDQSSSSSPIMMRLSAYDHPYVSRGFAYGNHHLVDAAIATNITFDTMMMTAEPSTISTSISLSASTTVPSSSLFDDDNDNVVDATTQRTHRTGNSKHAEQQDNSMLTGINLIGAAGLKCHGVTFSITHSNEVQFCAGMLAAVACGFAAFLGFLVNAVHVILADTRGEYLLEPTTTTACSAISSSNSSGRSGAAAGTSGSRRLQHQPVSSPAPLTRQPTSIKDRSAAPPLQPHRPMLHNHHHRAATVNQKSAPPSTSQSTSNNSSSSPSSSQQPTKAILLATTTEDDESTEAGAASNVVFKPTAAPPAMLPPLPLMQHNSDSKLIIAQPNVRSGVNDGGDDDVMVAVTARGSFSSNRQPLFTTRVDVLNRSVASITTTSCSTNECLSSYASIMSAPTPL